MWTVFPLGIPVDEFFPRKLFPSPSPHKYTGYVFHKLEKVSLISVFLDILKSCKRLLQIKIKSCISTGLQLALESPTQALCNKVVSYQLLSTSAETMIMLDTYVNGLEECMRNRLYK